MRPSGSRRLRKNWAIHNMSEIRLKKLESLLTKELSLLFLSGKIKDPGLSDFVSITRVAISKDTAYAKVYISSLEGADALESSARALNRAAGFLQSQLAHKIHLRQTPKLTFFPDLGLSQGFEINKKIEDISS